MTTSMLCLSGGIQADTDCAWPESRRYPAVRSQEVFLQHSVGARTTRRPACEHCQGRAASLGTGPSEDWYVQSGLRPITLMVK